MMKYLYKAREYILDGFYNVYKMTCAVILSVKIKTKLQRMSHLCYSQLMRGSHEYTHRDLNICPLYVINWSYLHAPRPGRSSTYLVDTAMGITIINASAQQRVIIL